MVLSTSSVLTCRVRAGDHEPTAGRHGVHELPDDRVRRIIVRDQLHIPDQQDGDGLGEIQGAGGPLEDGAGVARISIEIGGGAPGPAGQQRAGAGVHQDERVVERPGT